MDEIDIYFYDNILPEIYEEEDEMFQSMIDDWEADSYLSSMEAHEIWY